MTHGALLPAASLAPVVTHRLTRATIVWRSRHLLADELRSSELYCCPAADEAASLYCDARRTEWADRYGGTGIAGNGGSGRCSTFDGMQTKGVGRTPLVDPQADIFHSSGLLMLREAAAEAVFAEVYTLALPFGAIPTLALADTGGRSCDADDASHVRVRTLAFRPFAARPAHFMRCLYDRSSHGLQSSIEPGWSRDATRTRQALDLLADNFRVSLELPETERNAPAIIDAGLRELTRRAAWQCAASFAKRLPHGALSCSNLALNGAFLDFGLAEFAPHYRRRVRANGQDPWTEADWPLRTLLSLRDQLARYAPHLCGADLADRDTLQRIYAHALQERLGVEMLKMAGLTEDMLQGCPAPLLAGVLAALRAIWTHGADEPFSPEPGAMADGRPAPPPRRCGRHDLSAVLTLGCANSPSQAQTTSSLDNTLRQQLIANWEPLHRWLQDKCLGSSAASLGAYVLRQARRKNSPLAMLIRDNHASLAPLRELEWSGDAAVGSTIDGLVRDAAYTLADLDPDLPGRTGVEQLSALHAMRA